jgi:hypothetical protein
MPRLKGQQGQHLMLVGVGAKGELNAATGALKDFRSAGLAFGSS